MKPNVFVDFHHAGLLNSLILLFEKRLGGKVYRPIGMDWAEKGYWKIYDHPATQLQYLGINAATPDGTPPLNEVDGMAWKKGDYPFKDPYVYFCKDIEGHKFNNAITFDGFMNTDINIVIASIPSHVEPFKKLCEIHPSKPKLIFQIGNAWTREAAYADNIMSSAIIDGVDLRETNFILYHQEFDTGVFYPCTKCMIREYHKDWSMHSGKNIYSFINCFNVQPHLESDWQLFQGMERLLPDWNFKSFGGQCRDGSMDGTENLANKMREARFIWHTKNGGDGYGHVLHNAAAVGKPLIVKKSYYTGKLGDALLIDGITCINIDNLTPDEIIQKINYFSDPERYIEMSRNTYKNFQRVCNFNQEFIKIEQFLLKLK